MRYRAGPAQGRCDPVRSHASFATLFLPERDVTFGFGGASGPLHFDGPVVGDSVALRRALRRAQAPVTPPTRPRSRRVHGSTAVASISTLARGSSSPLAITTDIAG